MFYKEVDKNNNKEMFDFINNHFKYWTMNSWNRLDSIANNIKIHNLGLEKEQEEKALDLVFADSNSFWENIDYIIGEFEIRYPDYKVFTNGRQNGYLVLGTKQHNGSIVPESFTYETYEDMMEDLQIFYGDDEETLKQELKETVELIQDFDKLTDNLRTRLITMIERYEVKEIIENVPTVMTVVVEK